MLPNSFKRNFYFLTKFNLDFDALIKIHSSYCLHKEETPEEITHRDETGWALCNAGAFYKIISRF